MATPPTPDPIGAASARLFATGVSGRERLLALRFLGILLAQASDDGLVHADPDDLIGLGLLNGMEWDDIESSRRLLENVGVLEREPTGWFIRDFAPVGDEVPPADAMAAIARVLGKPAEGPLVQPEPVPEPVPLPLSPEITPVPEPSHSWFSPRWVAAPAGIAAAVLIVALLLSGQVTLPGRTVGNSRENAQEVNSERAPSPSGEPELSGTPNSSPSASAVGSTRAPAGSAPANGAPAGGPTTAAITCPLGAVLVTVEKLEQHVDSSVPTATPPTQPPSQVNATLPQIVHTTASGVLRNTSTVPAVVTPFPVDVTFTNGSGAVTTTVTAIALTKAVTVQPGQAVQWAVVVDNPDRTPFPSGAKAGALSWRWEDGSLAATCPH